MARRKNRFDFKQFSISQENSAMKVGTDGVVIGAWANVTAASTILDIGTGTGLIALMAAQRNQTATIHGIEIDPQSAAEAKLNVFNSAWNNRINIVESDVNQFAIESGNKYDVIISNPPYFNAGTISPNQIRHQARHDTGLTQPDLIEAVYKLLNNDGRFSLILPVKEGMKFINLAEEKHLYVSRKTAFYSKKDKPQERWLLEFKKAKSVIEEGEVIQYSEDGNWSSIYISLTRDFYLKL